MFQLLTKSDRIIYTIGTAIVLISLFLGIYTGIMWICLLPLLCAVGFWALLDYKSFFWFFIFTIPFAAYIDIPGVGLSTTLPDEPIMWFFLLVSCFILAYNRKIFPAWFFNNPLIVIIVFQYLWLIVAVIYSQHIVLSVKYLLAKTWYLNAFLILPVLFIKTKQDIIRLFKLFVIPVIILAVFIFIRHMIEGFSFWGSNDVVKPFFVNHVDHSTVLSMVFPLLIVAYQLSKGKKYTLIVLLLIILFFIPAIFVAQARAAMLAMVFALIVWFAISKRVVNYIIPAFYACIIALVMFLVNDNYFLKLRPDFKHTYTQSSFSDLLTATIKGKDMSSMERLYRWIASVRLSKDYPVVGVGPNNFYDHYKGYAVTMFKTYVSRNEERSTTHNYFLFMLVEQGWPALILYAVFVFTMFWYAQRLYYSTDDEFYKKVILGLAMVLAASFVNNFFSELLETHKIGGMFYLSIALLVIIDRMIKKEKQTLL
jgi:O-antigen ligase